MSRLCKDRAGWKWKTRNLFCRAHGQGWFKVKTGLAHPATYLPLARHGTSLEIISRFCHLLTFILRCCLSLNTPDHFDILRYGIISSALQKQSYFLKEGNIYSHRQSIYKFSGFSKSQFDNFKRWQATNLSLRFKKKPIVCRHLPWSFIVAIDQSRPHCELLWVVQLQEMHALSVVL